MSTIECALCGSETDAALCHNCIDQFEQMLTEIPGLVDDVITTVAREAHVYRSARRRRTPDEDWRGSSYALAPTALPLDVDHIDLRPQVRTALVIWVQILAVDPVVLTTGMPTIGPICADHVHDFTPEGCGHHPETCRHLTPHHVHSMKRRGCGLDVDSDGLARCHELHCDHESCGTIRRVERTGTAAALVRWFLHNRDTIRRNHRTAEAIDELTDLRDQMRRAVDRHPSRIYAGPCHAMVDQVRASVVDGTVYTIRSRGKCDRPLYAWFNPWRTRDDEREITCDGYQPDCRGDGEGCGTIHTVAARKDWLLASIDAELLPLAAWQAALPKMFKHLRWPHRSTWWRWVTQGRLVAKSIDRNGAELFRGGDVMDVVRAEQRRIIANQAKREKVSA